MGTTVGYDYQLAAGYDSLLVNLDESAVAPKGTVTMTADHLLTASAVSALVLPPGGQELQQRVRELLTATDKASAFQALLDEVVKLYREVGPDEAHARFRTIWALSVDPAVDAEALRSVREALRNRLFQTDLAQGAAAFPVQDRSRVRARAQPSDIVLVFVNGIWNEEEDALGAVAELAAIVDEVDAPVAAVNLFYNASAITDDEFANCFFRVIRLLSGVPFDRWIPRVEKCGREQDLHEATRQVLNILLDFPVGTIEPDARALSENLRVWLDADFKVIVVAHSQGNLMLQEALWGPSSALTDLPPGDRARIGVISLASPVRVTPPNEEAFGCLMVRGDIIDPPGRDVCPPTLPTSLFTEMMNGLSELRDLCSNVQLSVSVCAYVSVDPEGLLDLMARARLHSVVEGYFQSPESRNFIRSELRRQYDLLTTVPVLQISGGTWYRLWDDFSPVSMAFVWNPMTSEGQVERIEIEGPPGWCDAGPVNWCDFAPFYLISTGIEGMAASRSLSFHYAFVPVVGEYTATAQIGNVTLEGKFSIDPTQLIEPPEISSITATTDRVAAEWSAPGSAQSFVVALAYLVGGNLTGRDRIVIAGDQRRVQVDGLNLPVGAEVEVNVWAVSSDVVTPAPIHDQFNVAQAVARAIVEGGELPLPPAGLTAAAKSASQIDLSWSDESNNEAEFRLERRRENASNWTEIASTAPNVSSHSDFGLEANTTYVYRLRACNTAGCSGYSNEAVATTFAISEYGSLVVSTSTTGEDPDPNGYLVTVDETQSQTVGINSSVTFSPLQAGSHRVQLDDVAINCTVAGDNPRTVDVPANGTSQTIFSVSCPLVPPPAVDVTGKWAGGRSDNRTSGDLALILQQQGAAVSGELLWLDSPSGEGAIGSVNGSVSGNTFSGKMSGSYILSECKFEIEFSGTVDDLSPLPGDDRIVGTYSGSNECSGSIANGQFQVFKTL
jgi:hypothetical protein